MADFGYDSPEILTTEQAIKLMSYINDMCKKHDIRYLNNESNNYNNSSKLPDELRQ